MSQKKFKISWTGVLKFEILNYDDILSDIVDQKSTKEDEKESDEHGDGPSNLETFIRSCVEMIKTSKIYWSHSTDLKRGVAIQKRESSVKPKTLFDFFFKI